MYNFLTCCSFSSHSVSSSFRAKIANICLIIVKPLDHTCLSFFFSLTPSLHDTINGNICFISARYNNFFSRFFFYYRSEYKTNITLSNVLLEWEKIPAQLLILQCKLKCWSNITDNELIGFNIDFLALKLFFLGGSSGKKTWLINGIKKLLKRLKIIFKLNLSF